MDGKKIEIDGRVYDLEDPVEKYDAVRAWLRVKARGRRNGSGKNRINFMMRGGRKKKVPTVLMSPISLMALTSPR